MTEKDVERLHIHIAGLEATLAKRNQTIEALRAELDGEGKLHRERKAMKAEYKRGWQDACERLMTVTQSAAHALGVVRKDAFDVYLNAEREDKE